MRIISWNINGIKAHFDALQQLVNSYEPDILCLQKVPEGVKLTRLFQVLTMQNFRV